MKVTSIATWLVASTSALSAVAEQPAARAEVHQSMALAGGVTLHVADRSLLKQGSSTSLHLGRRRGTPTHVFQLDEGRVEVEVLSNTHAVTIRGRDALSATVKSGRAVVVGRDGKFVITNLQGETFVSSSQGLRPLGAGMKFEGSRGESQTQQYHPLPPPAFQKGPRVGMWIGDRLTPVSLQWELVSGAQQYSVEVKDSSGRVVKRTHVTEPRASIGDDRTGSGTFEVRVRAMDDNGIEGEASSPEKVQVTTALLPQGAYVDSRGDIRLLPGQEIRFTQATGLEVSEGKRYQWLNGTGSFGLERGEDLKLVVGLAGSRVGIPVHLRSSGVQADIKMTPANARWPEDPVKITLKVRQNSESVGKIAPAVSVLLGLKPLAVHWNHVDGQLQAVVPPQPGSGPCVVRVEVKDQNGTLIGRDFLEIDRASDGPHG